MKLVKTMDAIRMNRAASIGGELAFAQSVREYQQAFKDAAIGERVDDPALVASRVKASRIRATLVAMLDDCALYSKEPRQQQWFLDDFSSANLKVGNSFPATTGSGTFFRKLGSPASADFVVANAVPKPAAAAMKSRLGMSDMGSSLFRT